MVKINAAWFNRSERGTFAGIFGFMIQLGQIAINNLAPILLGGFTFLTWTVAKDDWHWLFRIPPLFVAAMAILLAFIPKESPEEAGYPGVVHDEATEGDAGTRATIKESFVTISSIRWCGFMRSLTAARGPCATVPINSLCSTSSNNCISTCLSNRRQCV